MSVPWPRFPDEMGGTDDEPERTMAWYTFDQLVGITMPALAFLRLRELRRRIDPR